jgi:hypothetical protein
MRWRSERELIRETDLEAAAAVEPETTDERIDIYGKYSAGWLLPNGVQRLLPTPQDALPCDILQVEPFLRLVPP